MSPCSFNLVRVVDIHVELGSLGSDHLRIPHTYVIATLPSGALCPNTLVRAFDFNQPATAPSIWYIGPIRCIEDGYVEYIAQNLASGTTLYVIVPNEPGYVRLHTQARAMVSALRTFGLMPRTKCPPPPTVVIKTHVSDNRVLASMKKRMSSITSTIMPTRSSSKQTQQCGGVWVNRGDEGDNEAEELFVDESCPRSLNF
jgi:hypothetical protein